MSNVRVIIVDDHPIFLAGLKKIINEISGFVVLAEARNKEEFYNLLNNESCDVVIIDMKMQNFTDGLEILKEIKSKWKKIKVVILSQYYKRYLIEEAINLGVDGYITKDDAFNTISMTLKKIIKGEKVFSEKIKSFLFDNLLNNGTRIGRLTPKEKEVLTLIVQGKKRNEIAKDLGITITTVDFHKSNIKSKLNAKTDLDLFEISKEYGLV